LNSYIQKLQIPDAIPPTSPGECLTAL